MAKMSGEARPPEIVGVELNLEEPPLFGGRVSVGESGYREYVQEYRKPDGGVGKRIWRWKPPEEYGELDVFDGDVYLAMHALAQEKLGGMPQDGRIPFTLYEVLNIMGLKDNGRNYRRVRKSILKINKTLMDAVDAFYRKDKKAYGSAHFIPWRVEFEMNEDRHGRATERHTLRFDEILVRSHMHGHLKDLDVNFCLSLNRNYAKSLYKRIDYKRGEGLVWSEDLMVLKDHLGMPASYRAPSKVIEKLDPSHQELRERGFLKGVTFEGGRVNYEVAAEFVADRVHLERSWSHEESAAYRALLRNGVWAHVARQLVLERGAHVCNFYVEALPYQKNVRDQGAWLGKYIRDRLPVPVEPPQRRLMDADADDARRREISWGSEAPVDEPEEGSGQEEAPAFPRHREGMRVWEEVLLRSAKHIDVSSMRVWFDRVDAVGFEDDMLTLAVPNSFAEEYIGSRFKEVLEGELRALRSPTAEIRIVVGRIVEEDS